MRETIHLAIERDVAVPMRDGTVLYADVYRPGAGSRHPVILQRTPYNKAMPRTASSSSIPCGRRATAMRWSSRTRRGRYASEGDFYCFRHEIDDGYDTVEWAARQPWSDGNVGMYGASYIGATQWLAAIARPPHLRAIVPMITASDYHEGWTYHGGAFSLGFNLSWTLAGLVLANFARYTLPPTDAAVARAELIEAVDCMCGPFETAPTPRPAGAPPGPARRVLLRLARASRRRRLLAAVGTSRPVTPSHGSRAQHRRLVRHLPRRDAAQLHGMREARPTPAARAQRLLVGPWLHAILPPNVTAARSTSASARQPVAIDLDGTLLRFSTTGSRAIDTGCSRRAAGASSS